MGKVVEVYAKDKEEKVRIRFFNTTVAKNATAGGTAKWTLWIGPKDYEAFDWVTSDRILLHIPQLTGTGLVRAPERDRIKKLLRYIADEKAKKALADEKAKKALATKESGEGEGDSEGDDSDDEGDDEGDDE